MSQTLQQQQQTQSNFPRIVDVSTSPCGKDTYLKMFMMDESVNANFWHVPINTMKKYASSFIGRPWIYHPSGDHPSYLKEGVVHDSPTFIDDILDVQNRYKAGDIIDVTYESFKEDPGRKGWFATIKVTNQDIYEKIKSGAISPYVSPQIYDLSMAEQGQPTTEFIPLHIATVNAPAYGNIARIRAQCNGSGPSCINALKSAAHNFAIALDNSSFLKNSSNNTNNTLTNNPIDPNQQYQNPILANSGFNPFGQTTYGTGQQYVDQNGQLISQKTQTQEVDANGNLITRTEDKKPKTQAQQQPRQQQQPQAQQQGQNIIADPQTQQQQQVQQPQTQNNIQAPPQPPTTAAITNPQITAVTPDIPASPQLPAEFVEMMKNIQASLTGVTERLNNVENFKKSAEDEKVKAASEAQRKIIESVFTPEVIADENARQNVIEKFVSLPLSDEDLKMILDMIVSGTFNNSAAPPKKAVPQNGPPGAAPPGAVKGASVTTNQLIMRQIAESNNSSYYGRRSPTALTKRFFSDIDVDNI